MGRLLLNDNSSIKIARLITIEKKIREAQSKTELEFLIVNELKDLVNYDVAILLSANKIGVTEVKTISNISVVDQTAPLVSYIKNLTNNIVLPAEENVYEFNLDDHETIEKNYERPENIPSNGLMINLQSSIGGLQGKLLILSSEKLISSDKELLTHLAGTIGHALFSFKKGPNLFDKIKSFFSGKFKWFFIITSILILLIPINMSALAPVEVSANNPTVVTSPINGVIKNIIVDTNDPVVVGDSLVKFDDTDIKNQYEVAQQTLAVAEAELLRNRQSSFANAEDKAKIMSLATEVGLKKKELEYAKDRLDYIIIKAASNGVAVIEDKNEWQGKPVVIGEKIMIIAETSDVHFSIYLPVKDSLVIAPDSKVKVFLDIDPLSSIEAKIDRTAYKPEITPEGVLAYKVVASLTEDLENKPRIGLRGTARIYGDEVTIFYYLFRTPINILRQWIGY